MCFGGGGGGGFVNMGTMANVAPKVPTPATTAAAVVAAPALARVSSQAASLIRRRPDEARMTLGDAPAVPGQTLRATLGGA